MVLIGLLTARARRDAHERGLQHVLADCELLDFDARIGQRHAAPAVGAHHEVLPALNGPLAEKVDEGGPEGGREFLQRGHRWTAGLALEGADVRVAQAGPGGEIAERDALPIRM